MCVCVCVCVCVRVRVRVRVYVSRDEAHLTRFHNVIDVSLLHHKPQLPTNCHASNVVIFTKP